MWKIAKNFYGLSSHVVTGLLLESFEPNAILLVIHRHFKSRTIEHVSKSERYSTSEDIVHIEKVGDVICENRHQSVKFPKRKKLPHNSKRKTAL